MTNIRQLPPQQQRVETGAVRFGDDWPGIFIRGDHVASDAACLRDIIESGGTPFERAMLIPLYEAMRGCIIGDAREVLAPLSKETETRLIAASTSQLKSTTRSSALPLEDAMNMAAAELPSGAGISVQIERDAGTVTSRDRDGNCADLDAADKTLSEQVLEHLAWCKARPAPEGRRE